MALSLKPRSLGNRRNFRRLSTTGKNAVKPQQIKVFSKKLFLISFESTLA